MSKNVSIEEGDRSRNFGPTSKIKTELQGGGECYWVPEDERFTAYVFASKNREYTAENISAYGIGEIDVNVIYAGVDPNGNPWYVYTDPNTGMPVIEYPEAKATDFDIRFPSGIASVNVGDNEYILEEVDTGEQIRVDKITGEIITVDPNYEDTDGSYPINVDPITGKPYVKDPETGEPFVDGDGNPINPVTGNPISIEDIQTGDNPAGVTITINPETGFPVIEDPFTGEPIAEFDDESMSNMGIDPTSDIDLSMDDPGDIEMGDPGDISIVGDIDGIPTVVDLDLDDMEWETDNCPASIKIMHVPNKTEYTDGWAIDYDGLVVQSFNSNGSVWTSEEYPDGYIPAHKLTLEKYADGGGQRGKDYAGFPVLPDNQSAPFYWDSSGNHIAGGASGVFTFGVIQVTTAGNWIRIENTKTGDAVGYEFPSEDPEGIKPTGARFWVNQAGFLGCARLFTGSLFAGGTGLSVGNVEYNEGVIVYVKWTSPCFEDLSASFKIKVNEKQDHDGSHHSGKF